MESSQCSVQMKGVERWWQGRGWQHTLPNMQSTRYPCQECGRKVTKECLEEHAASLCSNKRILCPLGCGTNLLRQAIVNLIMQSNVKWLSRPIKYPKVALASSSLVPTIEHKCLFLLSIVFQTNNADYSKKFCMHFAM